MLMFGTLYSGIGGADLALSQMGLRCAFQVERDPVKRRVLEHWWPGVSRFDDLGALNHVLHGLGLLVPDVLHTEPQNALPEHVDPVLDFVGQTLPRLLIVDVATGRESVAYDRIGTRLCEAGYRVECRVAQYGTSGVTLRDWRVVASEPRSRALYFARRDLLPAVEEAGVGALRLGPAETEQTLSADEPNMTPTDLEVARGFPPGWSSTACEDYGPRRLDHRCDARVRALREATSPYFAQWCVSLILAPAPRPS